QVSYFSLRAALVRATRPSLYKRRRRYLDDTARHNRPFSQPSALRYRTTVSMRGAGGAISVAVAVLILVVCSAHSHQESENGNERLGEHFLASDSKIDSTGRLEASSMRHVREAGPYNLVPYLTRRLDYMSPYNGKRDSWPMGLGGYYGEGLPKRNFDEIDRSGLDNFVRKRNFDEIDQTSMPFPYVKRLYHQYGPNYLDIDVPVSTFDKKRYRPDYPMDEIDLSHFPIGSKRSLDTFRLQH
ncbi:hypothetical protein ACJJTC_001724, partial [Scirpophaga incertulas]